MMELTQQAKNMNRAEKKFKVCFHGHVQGFDTITCLKCDKVFASELAWMNEVQDLQGEYC